MTPATRMPAACSNACWLTPGARAARACIDRPTCCVPVASRADASRLTLRDCEHLAAVRRTFARRIKPIIAGLAILTSVDPDDDRGVTHLVQWLRRKHSKTPNSQALRIRLPKPRAS